MLQNWPIRSKLVVILVVPLAALAVLSVIQVRGNVDNVRAANRTKALAGFAIKANGLVAALQVERFAANSFVGSSYLAEAQGEAATAARGPVDQALGTYRTGETDLPSDARDTLASTLDSISARLGRLAAQRRAIDGHQAQVDQNNDYYNELVRDLLSLNGRVAAGSHDARLVNGATTLVAISQAKEQAAQQRGAVARVIILGQTDPTTLRLIQTSAGSEDAWLQQFRTTATPDEQSFYNVTVGRTIAAATAMRDETVGNVQRQQPVTITQATWLSTVGKKIDAMHEVETRIATDLGGTSRQLSRSATRNALFGGTGVAVILILSVVISLLVASPMIRHLRRLRQGALEVANDRLPGVVERLHRGEPVDMDAEVFPVGVQSTDEIGQLADAFSTVHAVAVRTAVEQAAMRKSIGDTFLNLARRSQALIHRQLKIIDSMERKETDPDELEELFRLDHLATRMRRHAEDLIVLSGSKPARGWRRPVAIKDVVRGAVAEVEDYTRVRVMPIDGGAISGHAVGDIIHMLAELIENATSFSPPHTPVQVTGHEVSNGFVIEVEDRGLGMSPEEFHTLNDRLANPPPFDLSTSERLGLFVVGRLADRHSVSVRLRPSPYGGTMSIVLVPSTLLRQVEDPEDSRATGGGATVRALPAPAVPALDGGALDEDGFPGPTRSARPHRGPGGLRDARGRSAAPARDLDRSRGVIDPTGGDTDLRGTERPDLTLAAVPEPAGEADPDAAGFDADTTVGRADPGGPFGAEALAPTGPFAAPPAPTQPLVTPQQPADESFGAAGGETEQGWPVDTSARGGERSPAAGGSGSDEPLLDDLPVFATVRSSWFTSERGDQPGDDHPHGPGGPGGPGDPLGESRSGSEPGHPGGFPLGPDEAGGPEFPALPSRRARGGRNAFVPEGLSATGRDPGAPSGQGALGAPGRPGGFPAAGGPGAFGVPGGPIGAADPADPLARPSGRGEPSWGGAGGEPSGHGLVGRRDPLTAPLSRQTGPRTGGGQLPEPYPTGAGRGEAPAAGPLTPLRRAQPPARGNGNGVPDLDDLGSHEPEAQGLPQRTRRASLAPQLRRDAARETPAPLAAQRSPEEIRSMMSSFQSNFGRGLADGQDTNDSDDVGRVT
ncbi:nitrate- and nitrite sensing domain-containing protein [Frankia sp. Ag45/Mut15]|uniref:histidine kinase n=1 Tax=Frankia umida TaxID=573489 RepID=A0ABT0K0X3_9ACTN|nr:nitrate- and nitrite sensing domain-containing protein [Frankia umida]MCK9877433.1 nitrate- and nitrite sensing domain-containing protein [Frankia umida]